MDLICGGLVHLPTPVAKNKESELMRSRFKFKDSPLTSFSRARDVVRVTRRQQEDIKIVFSSDKRILDERRKSREGYDDVAKMKKEGLKRATIMKKTGMRERDARVAFLERISAPGEIGSPQEEEAVARQDEKDLGALLGEKVQELLEADSGPPRWYSPVEAQICPDNAPLFLCLPDIICNGLSLTLHQKKLARLFEVRCLHVPISDTTSNKGLIRLIESTIKEEVSLRPGRPIYVMGEGYGALLAISLAARNPDVDLVLILVNPATWCTKKDIMPDALAMLEAAPGPISSTLPFLFSLALGDPTTIAKAIAKHSLPKPEKSQQTFMSAMRDVLRVIATASVIWPRDIGPRRLEQLQMAARSAVRQMKSVKADVLLLASGKEINASEARKLKQSIPSATVRYFPNCNGALLLEEGVELVSLIKATNMYRRSKQRNLVTDYIPPSEDEMDVFRKVHLDIMKQLFSPVYLTTKENGLVTRGLPEITKERPVLFICNHTFVGFDLGLILGAFLEGQGVIIRSLAHPLITIDQPGDALTQSGFSDFVRLYGGVPVNGNNTYKLMAAKQAALLLPGGMREAVKRKEEAYKLIWPEKPEFVRIAIRHGAVIIPMATVGGDDFIQILLDQDQTLQFPVIGERLRSLERRKWKNTYWHSRISKAATSNVFCIPEAYLHT